MQRRNTGYGAPLEREQRAGASDVDFKRHLDAMAAALRSSEFVTLRMAIHANGKVLQQQQAKLVTLREQLEALDADFTGATADPEAMDRRTWPVQVSLPSDYCPLGV